MFPSKAHIYLSPFTDDEYYNNKIGFWKNVYGLNFSAIV